MCCHVKLASAPHLLGRLSNITSLMAFHGSVLSTYTSLEPGKIIVTSTDLMSGLFPVQEFQHHVEMHPPDHRYASPAGSVEDSPARIRPHVSTFEVEDFFSHWSTKHPRTTIQVHPAAPRACQEKCAPRAPPVTATCGQTTPNHEEPLKTTFARRSTSEAASATGPPCRQVELFGHSCLRLHAVFGECRAKQ
jgi:hypothetical protein